MGGIIPLMVFSNTLGIALMVVAGGIVGVGYFLLRLPDAFVLALASSVLIAVDLLVRLKNRHVRDWILAPETGGNFLLVPVWFLSAAIIFLYKLLPST